MTVLYVQLASLKKLLQKISFQHVYYTTCIYFLLVIAINILNAALTYPHK